jgi:hypothetical protein
VYNEKLVAKMKKVVFSIAKITTFVGDALKGSLSSYPEPLLFAHSYLLFGFTANLKSKL